MAIGLDDLALALLSSNQGHYAKAESLHKRALAMHAGRGLGAGTAHRGDISGKLRTLSWGALGSRTVGSSREAIRTKTA